MGKDSIQQLLDYYMGKNTPERQDFIIENLKVEKDELTETEDNPELEKVEIDELDDDLQDEFEKALLNELKKK